MTRKFYCQIERECMSDMITNALRTINIVMEDPEPWYCKGHDHPPQSMSREAIAKLVADRVIAKLKEDEAAK